MSLPVGNGYYIWLLERTAGGDPIKAAQMAKDAGLSWVTIKLADGPYDANYSRTGLKRDLVGPFVNAFRNAGISVWGWSYVYSYMPKEEALEAAKRVNDFDLDGYFIDAEVEYKGKPEQAKVLMKYLRQGLGNKPIGLCAFRFPTYHMTFPWKEFAGVNFNAPQVYWMMATNAGAQLRRAYNEHKSIYGSMPFIPIGAAFSEWGWTAQPAEITEFRKVAADLGLPGYGWWEWYDATVRHPELWKASVEGSVPTPQKSPEPKPFKQVMTKFNDLRIRAGAGTSFTILGFMKAGVAYNVYEEKVTAAGTWGRIAVNSPQWIHLGFTFAV